MVATVQLFIVIMKVRPGPNDRMVVNDNERKTVSLTKFIRENIIVKHKSILTVAISFLLLVHVLQSFYVPLLS